MIYRILFAIIGFIFSIIGITYIILYINLLTFGYTIKDYLEFILTKIECYLFPIGIIMECLSIKIKKEN